MTSRIRTTSVKSYPSYKDCGAPWIREIPEHWKTTAVKREYEIQMGKMLQPHPQARGDVAVPYLKALNVQWYSVHADNPQSMWATQEEIEQLEVAPGDLLVCEGGEGGRAGIVKSAPKGLIIQNALHRVRSRGRSQNQFLQHLLRVVSDSGWFEAINSKATIAHFTKEKFAALPIPIPPAEEQAAIVRFLDHADEQIGRYIAGKERLIALLEEQRQALVHQAVTRGLDPSVRLKPSGVEWLGNVPEHWELRRLKQVSVIQTGITIGPIYKEEDLIERPYLRVANVQSDHLDLSKVTTIRVSPADIKRATLEVGDVLMTEGGDIDKLGRGCLWLGEIPDCLHQNHVFAVRPDPAYLNPEFLVALMGSFQARTYFYVTAKQTTNLAATNRTTLGNLPMCLPGADEQQSILEQVKAECSAQDDAIAKARRQIALMNEYRTRLIADVVTGQLDVREAVSQLPTAHQGDKLPDQIVSAQETSGR